MYTTPDTSYGGLRWGMDLPEPLLPIGYILRMRTVPLRNLGSCISPDNSWMFIQGIETLPLRMDRHCENSLKVAEYLTKHDKVEWVKYPGLPGDKEYEKNQKYLKGKGGSLVVFGELKISILYACYHLVFVCVRVGGKVLAEEIFILTTIGIPLLFWLDNRGQGRCRGRQEVHRFVEAVVPCSKRRGCQVVGDQSRHHDPFPDERRTAARGWYYSRTHPPFDRYRNDRRHPCRYRTGVRLGRERERIYFVLKVGEKIVSPPVSRML